MPVVLLLCLYWMALAVGSHIPHAVQHSSIPFFSDFLLAIRHLGSPRLISVSFDTDSNSALRVIGPPAVIYAPHVICPAGVMYCCYRLQAEGDNKFQRSVITRASANRIYAIRVIRVE